MKNLIFLAQGFEEIEALSVVDILRRAGIESTTVSITDDVMVAGAHGINVEADTTLANVDLNNDVDWLILPGGLPGAPNLAACDVLTKALVAHNEKGGHIAAICASPAMVLSPLGILNGKSATCYPGLEDMLQGATYNQNLAVTDANVVTGKGPAAAIPFALEIVKNTLGENVAKEVADGLLYC